MIRLLAVCIPIILVHRGLIAQDKPPVPSDDALKEADRTIHEVFKDDYSKTKAEDKAQLVKKLLQQADESKDDPASRYALWREAALQAAQMLDIQTVLTTTDKIAATYSTNAIPLKKQALAAAAKGTHDPDLSKLITSETMLADVPDDPDANLVVGRYWAFTKGAWDAALPHLLHSSDPVLKSIAQRESANPADAVAQAQLGDAYWDLAEKDNNKQSQVLLKERACVWYEKARPTLTGLTKAKVEKRIGNAPIPPSQQHVINLITLIDVQKDARVAGDWKKGNGELLSGEEATGINIPYEPPDEYDFRVVFTKVKEPEAIELWCSKSGRQFSWMMAAMGNKIFRFVANFGGDATNPTVVKAERCLEAGRKYTSVVQVRNDGVKAFLDGKLISQFKTDYTDFGLEQSKAPWPGLALTARKTATIFHAVELIEITGKGKPTR